MCSHSSLSEDVAADILASPQNRYELYKPKSVKVCTDESSIAYGRRSGRANHFRPLRLPKLLLATLLRPTIKGFMPNHHDETPDTKRFTGRDFSGSG